MQFVSLHVTTEESTRKKDYYQHCLVSCLEKNWNSKLWRHMGLWGNSFSWGISNAILCSYTALQHLHRIDQFYTATNEFYNIYMHIMHKI